MITYKSNASGSLQRAYCGAAPVGYVENSRIGGEIGRWIWSLNMIQPKGGRASGILETEDGAKAALTDALVAWVAAAGLQFKEQGG